MPAYKTCGLDTLADIPVGASIEVVRTACGKRHPESLNFALKPVGGMDSCFSGMDEISHRLDSIKSSGGITTRIARSRLMANGRMLDALPVFAESLTGYCHEYQLAISGLFIRFASLNDMRTARHTGILAPDVMWHTDLRFTPTPPRRILPEEEGSEKIIVTATISPDDRAYDNGTQYVSEDGYVDTDNASVVDTVEELDKHEQEHPDIVAVDVTGRPVYVPDAFVDVRSTRSAPERSACRIPQSVVHRTNPEMVVDGAVGRVLISAFLRKV